MEILAHLSGAHKQRMSLVRRVVDFLGSEYHPTHVLLDGEDYPHAESVLGEFRDIAFYWNRERPTICAPAHVRLLMEDDRCGHLIWLSRRAIEEEEILFVWIVAHELRHFYQATQGFSPSCLRRGAQELRRRAEYRDLPSSQLGPAELDSDIFAMRTSKELIGSDRLNEFLARRQLPRCPFATYPAFLQCLEQLCGQ